MKVIIKHAVFVRSEIGLLLRENNNKYYLPANYACALWQSCQGPVCECVGSFVYLCIEEIFCVWPCPHFCEQRSHSDMKIYTHLLPFNYSWHPASQNVGMCSVNVGINMFWPAAKLSLMIDISETSLTN